MVYGKPDPASVDLAAEAGPWFEVTAPGPANESVVAGLGDVNGDDKADLAVGWGDYEVDVVFGGGGGDVSLVQSPSRGIRVTGGLSETVGSAGDFNNDGLRDLAIGSPGGLTPDACESHCDKSGDAFVVFGGPSGSVNARNLGAAGVRIEGTGPDDLFGLEVSAAGDFDGDEYDDLAVGAPGLNSTLRYPGR